MTEKSRGLVYTSFALLSVSLLFMVAFLPVTIPVENNPEEATRIGEAAFFMDSVLSDMDRSLEMSTRRALLASTNYVIKNNLSLADPGKNVSSALETGKISGEELESMNDPQNASLLDWAERVSGIAAESDYSLDIQLLNSSFNASAFEVESSFRVFARLQDPVTLANFNRTNSANATVSALGLEDPMILLNSDGRYSTQYSRCGFDSPANQLYTGGHYSLGSAHGYAAVNPATPDAPSVSDKGEKVLVTDDVDNYDVSTSNSFAGIVSGDDNDTKAGFTTKFIFDTGSIADIEQNMSLILNEEQVWRSSFRQMFEENCYLETSRGPNVIDRLGNRMVSPDGRGIATMIEVSELPSSLQEIESAVGYVYFNESSGMYGPERSIYGVTSEYSWFRLDDYHVNLWGVDDLAY